MVPSRHVPMLQLPVSFILAPVTDALWVESNAPAATPDAVVGFNERGEVVPGLRRKHPSRERHTGSVTERSDKRDARPAGATRNGARQIRPTKAIAKVGSFEEVHSCAEQAELVVPVHRLSRDRRPQNRRF